MTKQHFGTSHVPLSPAVRAGDFIYVSGQVPVGANGEVVVGGIEVQTRQVMENVKAALALAGAELSSRHAATSWILLLSGVCTGQPHDGDPREPAVQADCA